MKQRVSFDISFLKNSYGGKYVVLEGIDGSGKSTQRKLLEKYYKDKGIKVLLTHEPTRSGHIGRLVHDILSSNVKIPGVALQYLFAADRSVHQEEVIIP